ncbi:MAG: type II toxin-antitoxin system RelB/DinJ family antitoxin [Oscillibacter sp.]|nr:type II toxin-antitoxin system RelB/DinJ family antitoxin [Oscillibacter sp.]
MTVTLSFQTDAELKARFDAVLSKTGLTADSAFSRYMKELVEEYEIPTSPYLSTPATQTDDLRKVEEARENGLPDIPIEEILAELDGMLREGDSA